MTKAAMVAPEVVRAARRPRLKPDKLTSVLRAIVVVLHVLTSLYLMMWVVIVLYAAGPDVASARMYQTQVTAATYVLISVLHVGALAVQNGYPPSEDGPRRPKESILRTHLASLQTHRTLQQLLRLAATDMFDHVVIAMNFVVVVCQGKQAYDMLSTMVEPVKVVSYAVIVLLYSILSPCILFVGDTHTKSRLVHLADAVFTFTLSCGHPMLAVAIRALEVIVVNPNLARNNVWATETLLFMRLFAVTSPVDFFIKHVMHLGTFYSVRSLARSLVHRPSSDACVTKDRRRLRVVNLAANGCFGVVCAILLVRCLVHRTPCPPYCVSEMQPLLDLKCHCAYANINCHDLSIQDPHPLLDPTVLDTSLFLVQFTRCDLESGIDPAALAPFQQLFRVMIMFSNMSSWTGPLPASVNSVMVRYSRLEAIPHALIHDVPPTLVAVFLDSAPLKPIPDSVFVRWSTVQRLYLVNVSQATIPSGLELVPRLAELNFRGNNISSAFPETAWAATLKNVDLSGNRLTAVPWSVAKRGVKVDLSGNSIPQNTSLGPVELELVQKRKVILDDTPVCTASQVVTTCKSVCSAGCYLHMVGDFFCDLACLTEACGFDKGDCDVYGFT